MKLDLYFNGVVIGVMAALIGGGVPTLGATLHSHEREVSQPPEPAFSIGLALTYIPVVYVIGGGIAALVNSSNAVVNGTLLLLCVAAAHCYYIMTRGKRPGAEALTVATDIGVVAGLTDLFESGMSDALRESCQADCAQATRARLVTPDLKELFSSGSAIGESLTEALRKGLRLEALTDGRVTSAAELGQAGLGGSLDVLGSDTVDASGHWLILEIGKAVYFGWRGDGLSLKAMPICRGATDSSHPGRVVEAIMAVLDNLFDRARKGEYYSRVATSSSPKTYRERIVPAEAGAMTIDRIPKRLSVVFKGQETVRSIAEQRFGSGSASIEHYVQEHDDRRQEFFGALSRGMICREIYNEDELVWYVKSRSHSAAVVLSRKEIADTVFRWRQAIEFHPSYLVALTTDPIPFKYELIDGRLMSLHEAIGVSDSHRLNAIFIEGKSVGEAFLSDFNEIWERVPPNRRSKTEILKFVDNKLIPFMGESES